MVSDRLNRSAFGMLLLLAATIPAAHTAAAPCFPSDPEGENPNNLCLPYPTHGMSINSSSFRQGYASDGYTGLPLGPTMPGTPIQPGHPPRTPMDPRPTGNGYWTSVQASDGVTRVQTNTGRTWTIQTNP
jgi:hypothetical protein